MTRGISLETQLRDDNGQTLFSGVINPPLESRQNASPAVTASAVPAASIEGELYVRGPLVMRGYLNRPSDTALAIDPDGWFRTGDIVRIDSDGYLSITGRAKELIIVGGENVYPREVENVLESNPAVAEVAVIGQRDASRGEVVVAFVTLREGSTVGSEELRAFCRERLAGYKTPREVHIRSELPRGPTGKIIKSKLVAELAATSR